MEISLSSNSITDDHIATKFGTCHDSPAVVPCAIYCSDHFISIWMGAKWNFHHIWIVMEKLLVKWAPESSIASNITLITDRLRQCKTTLLPKKCFTNLEVPCQSWPIVLWGYTIHPFLGPIRCQSIFSRVVNPIIQILHILVFNGYNCRSRFELLSAFQFFKYLE